MSTNKKTNPSAVAQAEALVHQRIADHDAAIEHEATLDARLSRGDDTVTALNLTDAAAATRRATALLTAARESLAEAREAASKAEAMASPDLANAVVALLVANRVQLGLFGIPVEVKHELPASVEQLPAIYVVQDRATVWDHRVGTASGECRMFAVGTQGATVDLTAIREALRDLADAQDVARLDFGGTRGRTYPDGASATGTLVMVTHHKPAVATLDHGVDDYALRLLGSLLRTAVQNEAGVWFSKGVHIGAGDAGRQTSAVRVSTSEAKVVGSRLDHDGITRQTVEMTFGVSSNQISRTELQDNVVRAVSRLNGRFIGGAGRVEATEVVHVTPIPHGREMTAKLVLASRQV